MKTDTCWGTLDNTVPALIILFTSALTDFSCYLFLKLLPRLLTWFAACFVCCMKAMMEAVLEQEGVVVHLERVTAWGWKREWCQEGSLAGCSGLCSPKLTWDMEHHVNPPSGWSTRSGLCAKPVLETVPVCWLQSIKSWPLLPWVGFWEYSQRAAVGLRGEEFSPSRLRDSWPFLFRVLCPFQINRP